LASAIFGRRLRAVRGGADANFDEIIEDDVQKSCLAPGAR